MTRTSFVGPGSVELARQVMTEVRAVEGCGAVSVVLIYVAPELVVTQEG